MTVRTIPLSAGGPEGWRWYQAALTEIAAGRFSPEESIARLRVELDAGQSAGVLAVDGSTVFGVATWKRTRLPGRTVHLVYLAPDRRTPAAYREFLRAVIGAGPEDEPVAFLTDDLRGLDAPDQTAIMEALGFRRFSRTSMEFPDDAPTPSIAVDPRIRLRSVLPTDGGSLAELHRAAYDRQFDRYLFMEDPDPGRDSAQGMSRLLGGFWGPFLANDSFVAEEGGRLVGASLLVFMERLPLLGDAMVDPAQRGRRIGAAVIAASIASLRLRRALPLRLNVTGGNGPAERLYRTLGFVARSTDAGWYSPRCVPIPPEHG